MNDSEVRRYMNRISNMMKECVIQGNFVNGDEITGAVKLASIIGIELAACSWETPLTESQNEFLSHEVRKYQNYIIPILSRLYHIREVSKRLPVGDES
jgi:hypothetical protein